MPTPFPGMDPYLEHPLLWPGFHTAMMVYLRHQLTPLLRPRYVVSLEERVYVELPVNQRVPDLWVQKTPKRSPRVRGNGGGGVAVATDNDTARVKPLVFETPTLKFSQRYLEILDLYRNQRVVTVIELVSPSNKHAGEGRRAYRQKQRATLRSESHLVEIDLLRKGRHVMAIPPGVIRAKSDYEYLVSVNCATRRRQFEIYPLRLRERLPAISLPLARPDSDVPLDLQAALDQVYEDGSYMLRIKYDEPCVPPLSADDQAWADACWAAYRQQHPQLFAPGDAPPSKATT